MEQRHVYAWSADVPADFAAPAIQDANPSSREPAFT
jgi:hypothetical protein